MQKAKKNLWYSRRRRPLRYLVYLPCGLGARVLVRGVAAPEALDEGGGGDAATDHVLLTLLLLHLQGEARTQDALWCAIVSMLLLCFLSNELYTKGKKVAPVVTFCPLLYQGKVVPFQQEVSSSPTLQDRMVQRTKPLTSKESYAKTFKTRYTVVRSWKFFSRPLKAISFPYFSPLTAGSAKKEMPRRAQQEAIILPFQVCGTASP